MFWKYSSMIMFTWGYKSACTLQDSLDPGIFFGIISLSIFYAFHLSCISSIFSFRPSFNNESAMSINTYTVPLMMDSYLGAKTERQTTQVTAQIHLFQMSKHRSPSWLPCCSIYLPCPYLFYTGILAT